jgi:hypothetical protein
VVLKALPEEYAYDFKTADETYIKADKIAKWMQFPDSDYKSSANACIASLDARIAELEREMTEALAYATSLLVTFVNRYCSPVTEWKPLPELVGVLTQLDNATTIVGDMQAESDSLRAKLDRATGALKKAESYLEFLDSCDEGSDEGPIVLAKVRAVLSELSADAPEQTSDVGSVTLPGGDGGSSVGQISGSASSGGLSVGVAHVAAQISDEVREAMVEAEKALDFYANKQVYEPDSVGRVGDLTFVARGCLAKLRSVMK